VEDKTSQETLTKATEIGGTGLLNYHLKVLSDLIIKNESGQYMLAENGKLASRLLIEFPEDQVERKIWQKRIPKVLKKSS
jgi:hypothetical protein